MSSVEIYILVEGRTEQTFIRDILAPELADRRIYLYPALIGKPGHKGGNIKFEIARNDIGSFLKQRTNSIISTMFDYSRIDSQWPGKTQVINKQQSGKVLPAVNKAEIIESATKSEIAKIFPGLDVAKRFIPYIEMHEFEALLFSDAKILASQLEIDLQEIHKILHTCGVPEEINDNPSRSPAKLLEGLSKGYRKVAFGKTISEAIGISTIRAQCAHFNQWLETLEHL